ncbi:hypothetical protein C5S29_04275, partial [ANME-1 cluster archaeon GoMg3.2]|nr:hypothetical protein [ANME-1 cluster archaeon GoMg3.2]
MSLAWCGSMRGRKGEEGRRRGGALYKCPKKLGGEKKKKMRIEKRVNFGMRKKKKWKDKYFDDCCGCCV